MRSNGRTKLNKVLLLITALAMVLLLSGCRTRLSNNTEVASTISDEDGWLQETYQMRRDDLGMPVAKKPFITGSSDEELDGYDDYDSAMEDLNDYINNPEEDDFYDTVDGGDDNRSSSQTSSSSTTTRRNTSSTIPKRRATTTKKKTSPAKKNTSTKTDTNPSQEQEQQEQPKKQYTVSFDGCGVDMDGATISVEEGGKYGSLPNPPTREGWTFDGWFTEDKGGKKIEEGDDYTSDGDQTLYAHWTQKDPAEIWGNRFDVAANDQKDKLDCLVQGNNEAEKIVGECKGNIVAAENAPKCIIVFAANENVSDEEALRIFGENSVDAEGNPTALEKVIIISDESINGSDKQKLFYKLVLLNEMHGKVGQTTLDEAASDLGISKYWLATYPQP